MNEDFYYFCLFSFLVLLVAWPIASHLSLPVRCIFIPKNLRIRREVLGYPTRITSKISAPLLPQSEVGAPALGSCDGISSSIIGNTLPSFTSSLDFRSQITMSAPSRATASAIARPTDVPHRSRPPSFL